MSRICIRTWSRCDLPNVKFVSFVTFIALKCVFPTVHTLRTSYAAERLVSLMRILMRKLVKLEDELKRQETSITPHSPSTATAHPAQMFEMAVGSIHDPTSPKSAPNTPMLTRRLSEEEVFCEGVVFCSSFRCVGFVWGGGGGGTNFACSLGLILSVLCRTIGGSASAPHTPTFYAYFWMLYMFAFRPANLSGATMCR
jgi:hypothetical protein